VGDLIFVVVGDVASLAAAEHRLKDLCIESGLGPVRVEACIVIAWVRKKIRDHSCNPPTSEVAGIVDDEI